jgi:TRAP-type uncharacterized transport system fused permease subunit
MFAYDQSLLLQGPALKIIVDFLTACLGAACFAMAGVGFFLRNLRWVERLLAAFLGIALIMPDKRISLVGGLLLALYVTVLFYSQRRMRKG